MGAAVAMTRLDLTAGELRRAARKLPLTVASEAIRPVDACIASHPVDRPADSERLRFHARNDHPRRLLAAETDFGGRDAGDWHDVFAECDRAICQVHDNTKVLDRIRFLVCGSGGRQLVRAVARQGDSRILFLSAGRQCERQ